MKHLATALRVRKLCLGTEAVQGDPAELGMRQHAPVMYTRQANVPLATHTRFSWLPHRCHAQCPQSAPHATCTMQATATP